VSENRESTRSCTWTAKDACKRQVQQKHRGFQRKVVPSAAGLSLQKTISALTAELPKKDKTVISFDNSSMTRLSIPNKDRFNCCGLLLFRDFGWFD